MRATGIYDDGGSGLSVLMMSEAVKASFGGVASCYDDIRPWFPGGPR